MRVLDLASLPHQGIDAHGSRGFQVGAFCITSDAHLTMVTLRRGGVIGRHAAPATQLLVVVSGEAMVSGEDGAESTIGPGQAAVWDAGEPHETRSTDGLVAMVVEGDVDVAEPGRQIDRGDT